MSDTVKITVNGKEVDVPEGTNLIRAVKMAGSPVPHFCYHKNLSVAGNCRMCIVEIEGVRGLPIACNSTATEGLVVNTESEKVKDTRAAVMEFLLINHPIDCPVCDQAGECKLQQYYMEHDRMDSAVAIDDKVKKGKAIEVGPRVMLDQERCVACSRCVRFCDEVSKTGELRLMERGDHTTIDTFPGRELDNAYSVNTVDICPVGALTSRDFRFQARAWYLRDAESICPGCATGCNIDVSVYDQIELSDYNGQAYRIRPRENDAVNKTWMCDAGRDTYTRINTDRIDQPFAHGIEVSWEGAISRAHKLLHAASTQPGAIVGVMGFDCTNEEAYLFQKMLHEVFGTSKVALLSSRPLQQGDDLLIDADPHANRRGVEAVIGDGVVGDIAAYLEGAEGVIVLGADPRHIMHSSAIRNAFAGIKQQVVFSSTMTGATEGAPIVLPTASFLEKEGTWVNREGRIQRLFRGVRTHCEAREDVLAIAAFAQAFDEDWVARAPIEIFSDLVADLQGAFNGLTYDAIGKLGTMTQTEASSTDVLKGATS